MILHAGRHESSARPRAAAGWNRRSQRRCPAPRRRPQIAVVADDMLADRLPPSQRPSRRSPRRESRDSAKISDDAIAVPRWRHRTARCCAGRRCAGSCESEPAASRRCSPRRVCRICQSGEVAGESAWSSRACTRRARARRSSRPIFRACVRTGGSATGGLRADDRRSALRRKLLVGERGRIVCHPWDFTEPFPQDRLNQLRSRTALAVERDHRDPFQWPQQRFVALDVGYGSARRLFRAYAFQTVRANRKAASRARSFGHNVRAGPSPVGYTSGQGIG